MASPRRPAREPRSSCSASAPEESPARLPIVANHPARHLSVRRPADCRTPQYAAAVPHPHRRRPASWVSGSPRPPSTSRSPSAPSRPACRTVPPNRHSDTSCSTVTASFAHRSTHPSCRTPPTLPDTFRSAETEPTRSPACAQTADAGLPFAARRTRPANSPSHPPASSRDTE